MTQEYVTSEDRGATDRGERAQVTIRPAIDAEIPRLQTLAEETWRAHAVFAPQVYVLDEAAHALLHRMIEEGFVPKKRGRATQSDRIFVAEVDGTFAGYVMLSDRPDGQASLEVCDICVQPAFRKRGVGAALLAHARDLCEAAGVHSLRGQVWTGNPGSAAMFLAAGFDAERTVWRHGPRTGPPAEPEPPPPESADDKLARIAAAMDLEFKSFRHFAWLLWALLHKARILLAAESIEQDAHGNYTITYPTANAATSVHAKMPKSIQHGSTNTRYSYSPSIKVVLKSCAVSRPPSSAAQH